MGYVPPCPQGGSRNQAPWQYGLYAKFSRRCNLPKTAVGLFENPSLANQVVLDLEASGFSQNDLRILGESLEMAGSGVMGIPNIDFEVSLNRDLRKIGTNGQEAEAYVNGVRRGGVLVFASGADERIDSAAKIMNGASPAEVEELTGGELDLPSASGEDMTPARPRSVQTGRVRQSGGARVFSW